MNLFTVNQVNQVYVVNGTANKVTSGNGVLASDLGSVYCGITPNSAGNPKSIYFKHRGKGGVTRTDLIDIDKIMYCHAIPASKMSTTLNEVVIRLNSSALDSNKLLAGYDFILRINLDNYIGISPEDSTYMKYGVVHTGPNMTVSQFWQAMAKSILRNMSREAVKFIEIYAVTGATSGAATVTSDEITLSSDFGGTYVDGTNSSTAWANVTGIAIREVEPNWTLGLGQQKVVHIGVTPVPIETKDGTVYWGFGKAANSAQSADNGIKVTPSSVSFNNSKLAADYEYFYHGERGDQYRMVGWPDYIPTKYMVDADSQYGYDFVQIHYSYIGSNESCQKSEKDLTFLVPRSGSGSTVASDSSAGKIYKFVTDAINSLGADAANAAIAAQIADDSSDLNTTYQPKSNL